MISVASIIKLINNARIFALPDKTGNANKVLTVSADESIAEWKTPSGGTGGYDGNPATITQDSTHRFTTDTEKATWNGQTKVAFLANESISANIVVTSTGVQANSATIAHRGKIIGISTASVSSGFMGSAKGFGEWVNATWSWTIGDKIYLNGTSLSTTAPSSGFIQFIGTATASDTININLGPAILL